MPLREEGYIALPSDNRYAVWVGVVTGPTNRPPFRRLVPLRDLVAACLGVGVATKTVARVVDSLIERCGSELGVLVETGSEQLCAAAGEEIAAAIIAVRREDIEIEPGYDGVFGVVAPRSD